MVHMSVENINLLCPSFISTGSYQSTGKITKALKHTCMINPYEPNSNLSIGILPLMVSPLLPNFFPISL
jgi:hypothetical protein